MSLCKINCFYDVNFGNKAEKVIIFAKTTR